jgi:RNA polymerase sigma factor (sigma-70 family)
MTSVAIETRTTAELVDAARHGEGSAFEEIVLRYERCVWSVVRRYRLSHADAQDVVQITWLRLVENLDRLHDPDRLASWLVTTAGREALRVSRRRMEVGDAEKHLAGRTDDRIPSPEQHALDRVMAGVLRTQVATLPARAQALLWTLVRHDAPAYSELARQMAMPVGSIGPTRGRYLRRLRQKLEQVGLTRDAWY